MGILKKVKKAFSKKNSNKKKADKKKAKSGAGPSEVATTPHPSGSVSSPPDMNSSLDPGTEIRTPESPAPTMPQDDKDIPLYKEGCPDCGEFRLVTERKHYGQRVCRCIMPGCGWRGKMR